jgi:hypothetical protein
LAPLFFPPFAVRFQLATSGHLIGLTHFAHSLVISASLFLRLAFGFLGFEFRGPLGAASRGLLLGLLRRE